ncbi:hypothetical protein HDU93_004300 [Gonapodya sp. JEL0774]|nr:hypothetical protein HDU93_004300 [Gonapodya sp. JEL0774]
MAAAGPRPERKSAQSVDRKTADAGVPLLFTPFTMRSVTLKNRIVVAPMHQYAAVDGFPTDHHIMNYARYAAGGFAMVMVESTKVDRRGCGTVGDLGLWHDDMIQPLARIASVIKSYGSVPAIQLGHSGRKARTGRPWEGGRPLKRQDCPEISDASWSAWELIAPSAVPADAHSPTPRALSTSEMDDLVTLFARAAHRAVQAGFQCVEIHAAHGFFIHETLSPIANLRTDAYGKDRTLFARSVANAVRSVVPPDFPVWFRLSVADDAGWTPSDSSHLASLLHHECGVDLIDCSAGGMTAAPLRSAPVGYGYQVPFAAKLRREAGVATGAVGCITECTQAERILRAGDADLVLLAREALYNPNWPVDAAIKMGLDGWWLSKRHATIPGLITSTTGRVVDEKLDGTRGKIEAPTQPKGVPMRCAGHAPPSAPNGSTV